MTAQNEESSRVNMCTCIECIGDQPEPDQIDMMDTDELRDEFRKTLIELESLKRELAMLVDFVTKVSTQTPEKPDYWSSCGQCERNSNEAEEIVSATSQQSQQWLENKIADTYEDAANLCANIEGNACDTGMASQYDCARELLHLSASKRNEQA